jgi:uridine kinase
MLILISGSSASGKSTLSSELSKIVQCIIIPQDSFYTCNFDVFPYDNNADGKLESPDLIDWEKLVGLVESIPKNVNIIVEGHCIFTCKRLMELADYKFFIKIDYVKCLNRFVNRYSDDNYTTAMIKLKNDYFMKYTWPIHKEYAKNNITTDVITVDSNLDALNVMKDKILS